jgi:hypothetical protein
MSPLLEPPPTEKSARTRRDTTTPPGALRGTDGSNPFPSSGESPANLTCIHQHLPDLATAKWDLACGLWLKDEQLSLLHCDIMGYVHFELTEIGLIAVRQIGESAHGKLTQIGGPEYWVVSWLRCEYKCAVSIDPATGWQYTTIIQRHAAGAECPHRRSRIDAKFLPQARRRRGVEGGSLSAPGAICHRCISLHERGRPQAQLAKVKRRIGL